jgi:uncharacterized low-complexity protein
MRKPSTKPVAAALGAAIAGLALSGSAFSMQPLAQGYMLGAAAGDGHAAGEGKCGEGKCGEGKCGEGKCDMDAMDADKDGRLSQAEFAAAHDGDASRFAEHDPDGDGFVSAGEMKAHHAAKAEAKAGKAAMEGKCGEGKCGGAI